jgi:NitT/TauT family transport system ATP-binding protein
VLKAEGLSFAYGDRLVLEKVSFALREGQVGVMTAPSGHGKSTLARVLSGHLRPRSGRVFLNDGDVTGRPSRRVFLVPQDGDLFAWQTAWRHLEFARAAGVGGGERGGGSVEGRDAAALPSTDELLALVRLEGAADSYPKQLSGGMQRRLALARALAVDPDVLILDEVLSAQDEALREDLMTRLLGYWRARGTIVIVVTHDLALADRIADVRLDLPTL